MGSWNIASADSEHRARSSPDGADFETVRAMGERNGAHNFDLGGGVGAKSIHYFSSKRISHGNAMSS